MKYNTSVVNRENFKDFKNNMRVQLASIKNKKNKNPQFSMPYPMDIEMEITHKCNLACQFCFQRTESMKAHNLPRKVSYGELDVSTIEKVLRETDEVKSGLYIQGGEPLVHRDWSEIAKIFEKYPRRIRLSTNGFLVGSRMESILRISSNFVIIFSLHGFRSSIDAYYGARLYDRLINSLELLMSLKKKGVYKGTVTIHTVLNQQLIPNLFEFTKYCQDIGADNLIISYPWYITDQTRRKMNVYFKKNFAWLGLSVGKEKPSWYNFSFHLNPSLTNILKEQIEKIYVTQNGIPIRFHPALENDEIYDHILGKTRIVKRKQFCMNILKQMFIFPDGDVSACRVFREFTVGNIYKQDLMDIWKGEKLNKVREIMNNSFDDGSWPIGVCAKCNLLSGNQL